MEKIPKKIILLQKSQKKILLSLFKMVTNQNSPGLNRGLSSNICWLRSENYVEFTDKICDVHGHVVLVEKNVYEWTKQDFVTPVKKTFWAQRYVKKVMLIIFLNMKGIISSNFL